MRISMTTGFASAVVLVSAQLCAPSDSRAEPLNESDAAGAPSRPIRSGEPPRVVLAPSKQSGTALLEDDFESYSPRDWGASGNNTATITRTEHFRGESSIMLKVGPSDPVNYRTEIVLRGKIGRLHANKDYCIRFAFKAKDWSDFPKWVTLFQTHAIPANGDFSCQAGRNSISLVSGSSRNLALAVIDRPVSRRRAGAIAEVVHSQDLVMDRWYSVQFHYRPAFDDRGIIEAWIDGKDIFSQSGGNMDPTDQCGRPSDPFTQLKLGLYKERGNGGTQTVYYDDFALIENSTCK